MSDVSYKKFFNNYGFFVAILTVVFGILIYTSKVAQKKQLIALKETVENVLEEKEPSVWSVGNSVKINNIFCLSAACYEVRNKSKGGVCLAVLVRTSSLYGPIPVVFLYDKNANDNKVSFVGYASLHGRINEIEADKGINKRLSYWMKKIPEIIP